MLRRRDLHWNLAELLTGRGRADALLGLLIKWTCLTYASPPSVYGVWCVGRSVLGWHKGSRLIAFFSFTRFQTQMWVGAVIVVVVERELRSALSLLVVIRGVIV